MDEFQSTRPRGARQLADNRANWQMQFQSTRPRGARLDMSNLLRTGRCFNPRAHVGRD